jgi:glycosyltransferase involved in cell wall biosynthesis
MVTKVMIALNSTWNLINFRSGLMQRLINEGYELIAVSPEDDYVDALKTLGCEYLPIRLKSKSKNIAHELKLIIEIYRLLKLKKPDVVLSYTIKPNLYFSFACHLLSIPIINTVTGLGTAYLKDNWLNKLVSLGYKQAFKKSKKVFFQNEADLNFFLSKGLVSSKVSAIIPGSGINLQKFAPSHRLRLVSHVFQFLFLGRILYDKGVIELVAATRLLREKGYVFQTAILGFLDPNNQRAVTSSQMRQWIDMGDVQYLGETDDIRPFVSRADCVVLPSYREGISRALLEAAAMAKPIIATNVPGCSEVVEDGYNGYLCQIKDPIDLALKMEKILLHDYAKIDDLGRNGRNKVERTFSENIVIDKYLDVIKTIEG